MPKSMSYKRAFKIVLELADGNMIDDRQLGSEKIRDEQEQAMQIVRKASHVVRPLHQIIKRFLNEGEYNDEGDYVFWSDTPETGRYENAASQSGLPLQVIAPYLQ